MAEESELVVAGDVVAEVMEREAGAEAVGSVEYLGRWKGRTMPDKIKVSTWPGHTFQESGLDVTARTAFGRLVDELVQKKASSGILAFSKWYETYRDNDGHTSESTGWGFSWSASADAESYRRDGFARMESTQHENIRFADFEGVVDDCGDVGQMAVYRVTLPSGGLDPDKWVGRPPPPAPEDLYTGPRSDGLLSTGEISGEYYSGGWDGNSCCRSMTVVPRGPDVIETWDSSCAFCPPCTCGPTAETGVRIRRPGTNAFRHREAPESSIHVVTFSADGMAKAEARTQTDCCDHHHTYKKNPASQNKAFRKIETKELAGTWCGCCCIPIAHVMPFSAFFCFTKKALDEDRYAESGLGCGPWTLCLPLIPAFGTRTRIYVGGIPTNAFDASGSRCQWVEWYGGTHWHRDPGCAYGNCFFAKKLS